MRIRSTVVLLLFAFACNAQSANDVRFSGIAINTTDPNKPLAAPMEFSLEGGQCRITISQPLTGSSLCRVTSFDEASGQIEVVSDGAPVITWSGTIKGNLASGTYTIGAGSQRGTFYWALVSRLTTVVATPPVPSYVPVVPVSRCTPAIESSISGEFHGWDGETIFKLDNGQIWEQAEYDYEYEYAYHPDVTIYPTSSGCRMKVEDMKDTITVKRIK